MKLRNVKYNPTYPLNNLPFQDPEDNSRDISIAPQMIPNCHQMNEGTLNLVVELARNNLSSF